MQLSAKHNLCDGRKMSAKYILYIARITSDLPNYNAKEYKGMCSTTWKERYRNRRKAFRNDDYEMDYALSEEVWNIKRKDGQYTIQWQKHQHFPSYTPETIKCSLCMNEKLEIALHKASPARIHFFPARSLFLFAKCHIKVLYSLFNNILFFFSQCVLNSLRDSLIV